jgi:hypothetical protein
MPPTPTEFQVYSKLIEFLNGTDWEIICASPPAGTDYRYRKCLIPRRDLGGSEKGPRDEVDLAAYREKVLMVTECKARLSDSFSVLNALGESDYEKLKRIMQTHTAARLAELFRKGTGAPVPEGADVAAVLAVGLVDAPVPTDVSVMEFGASAPRLFLRTRLLDQFWSQLDRE